MNCTAQCVHGVCTNHGVCSCHAGYSFNLMAAPNPAPCIFYDDTSILLHSIASVLACLGLLLLIENIRFSRKNRRSLKRLVINRGGAFLVFGGGVCASFFVDDPTQLNILQQPKHNFCFQTIFSGVFLSIFTTNNAIQSMLLHAHKDRTFQEFKRHFNNAIFAIAITTTLTQGLPVYLHLNLATSQALLKSFFIIIGLLCLLISFVDALMYHTVGNTLKRQFHAFNETSSAHRQLVCLKLQIAIKRVQRTKYIVSSVAIIGTFMIASALYPFLFHRMPTIIFILWATATLLFVLTFITVLHQRYATKQATISVLGDSNNVLGDLNNVQEKSNY